MDEEVKKAWEALLAEIPAIETMGDNIEKVANALNSGMLGSSGNAENWKTKYDELRADYIRRFTQNELEETREQSNNESDIMEEEYNEPDIDDLDIDYDGRSE